MARPFGPVRGTARSGVCGPRAARSTVVARPDRPVSRHGPLILFYMLWFCALFLWYNLWIEICFAWNNEIVCCFFHMLWFVKKLTFVKKTGKLRHEMLVGLWTGPVTEPPDLYKFKYDCPRLTRWQAHTLTYINPVVCRVSRRTSVNQLYTRITWLSKYTSHTQRFVAEIILQKSSQIIIQVWIFPNW